MMPQDDSGHENTASDGQLRPCPNSPNCVVSRPDADARHRVEPLAYKGSADEAMARLQSLIDAMPLARVVTATDRYLHAEVRTRFLRFVDDVEFLVGVNGRIDVRSASRVGHSDFGANHKRVEAIRQRLARATPDRDAG